MPETTECLYDADMTCRETVIESKDVCESNLVAFLFGKGDQKATNHDLNQVFKTQILRTFQSAMWMDYTFVRQTKIDSATH